MLKKALLMLLCLITFISAVPFSFVSADGAEKVVFVSSSGNDAGNGTQTFPYKTLEKCFAELRQGGIIVVKDKLGSENHEFLEKNILNYPHSGKITITGMNPEDGKAFSSAGFSYSTINLVGDVDISHLTISTSGSYCFINTLGHEFNILDKVRVNGDIYFHAGAVGGTADTVRSQKLRIDSGKYASIYLGGGYVTKTSDGVGGDCDITISDAYTESLIMGFDAYLDNHTNGTLNGNIRIEINDTVVYKLVASKIHNNYIPGYCSIILNNSAVGYTISFPNATGGVFVISTHGNGSAHSTGKAGEYDILPDAGYTAYLDGKAIPSGKNQFPEGEHIIRFIKDNKDFVPTQDAYINGYEDGSFRPDGGLTRAEAATLAKNAFAKNETTSEPCAFTDVSNDAYYYATVAYLDSIGALPTDWHIDNLFEGAKPMTRGEFVSILYALCAGGINEYKYNGEFADELPKAYADAIMRMSAAGFITGYSDKTFGADRGITRAEAVTVINRILKRQAADGAQSRFSDTEGHWANGQIIAASTNFFVPTPIYSTGIDGTTKELVTGLYEQSASLTPTQLRQGIDEVSQKVKQNILNSKDELVITGTKYYVSEKNGNDKNDGRSPEKPLKSIGGIKRLTLRHGDAVLFERGGIYRGTFNATHGVSYGAYGEGPKPLIMQSKKNYAEPKLWKSTEHKNVYVCTENFHNVGIIGFDHDLFDYSENTYKELYGIPMNKNILGFSGLSDLDTDLQFYSDRADGKLYIYSAQGNPGERFSSIEIGEQYDIIDGIPEDVVIDNLAFKFTGAHAIGSSSTRNLTVTNCVFSWLGGSVLSDNFNGGGPINYGNAVEIYGSCNGYYVENNWMYQIYDTAVTHQQNDTSNCTQENIRYYGNLMEYNHWGIEFYNLRGASYDKDSKVKYTRNVHMAYNIMRMGGFGWGTQERHRSTAARLYSGSSLSANYNELTEYNIFDRCTGYLYDVPDNSEEVLKKNIFVQYEDMIFGCIYGRYQKNHFDSAKMMRYYLHDDDAVLVFINND